MYANNDLLQPDSLKEILALRPDDAENRAKKVNNLEKRMKGAFVGRLAGCILGVPVEGYSVLSMQSIAIDAGMEFPPKTYWTSTDQPDVIRYRISPKSDYLEQTLRKAPVDDDITYTVLNLLLLEKYGKDYSVQDVGELWLNDLPYACTAEDEALQQLKVGTKAEYAASFNFFVEWIGAAIRADAFGYVCAGNPEKAAVLCYNDAYLSHRKNGIYGEMFCAAAIAAAFTAKTPLDAIREGMKQIPQTSELYKALEWAFSVKDKVTNYASARILLDEKFGDMHICHTINNMAAIVFALILGGNDFEKCIGNAIAIGLDNDCTGATVGSIVGACLGIDAIPAHWYDKFNDTVCTYVNGNPCLSISDVVERFVKLCD